MSSTDTERTAVPDTQLGPVLVDDQDTDARRRELASVVERVAITGDLSQITAEDRVRYYARLCQSLDLNPLTKPFEYMWLNTPGGRKLVLYAKRDATDQLRASRRVSITAVERSTDTELGLYSVLVRGRTPDGRTDESTGIVNIKGLQGEQLANAMMKGETKGKRRLTLSLVGLGFLDESEVADLPDATPVRVDPDTGEIMTPPELPPAGTDRLRSALGMTSTPAPAAQSGQEPAPEPEVAPAASPAAEGPAGEQVDESDPATTQPVRCAHPPSAHQPSDQGVTCQLCGTLLSKRDPIGEAMKPKSRKKPAEAEPGA